MSIFALLRASILGAAARQGEAGAGAVPYALPPTVGIANVTAAASWQWVAGGWQSSEAKSQ